MLRGHVYGSHTARLNVVPRSPKPAAAQAPVDALNGAPTLTGHTQHGKFAIRGPAAILARLPEQRCRDRAHWRRVRRAGHRRREPAPHEPRDELQLLTRLLVPYILNGAVHCEVTRHRELVEAVTLAFAIPPRSLVHGERAVMSVNRLPTHRPVTLRDVRPMNIYDVVPPEGRAGIERAKVGAVVNGVTRKMDAVVQRLDDLREAQEERKREGRRRGR